jgi:hypothetical protein
MHHINNYSRGTYKNKLDKGYLRLTLPATPYNSAAIKALLENARKELASAHDHRRDVEAWMEFTPEQRNEVDIV